MTHARRIDKGVWNTGGGGLCQSSNQGTGNRFRRKPPIDLEDGRWNEHTRSINKSERTLARFTWRVNGKQKMAKGLTPRRPRSVYAWNRKAGRNPLHCEMAQAECFDSRLLQHYYFFKINPKYIESYIAHPSILSGRSRRAHRLRGIPQNRSSFPRRY